MSLQEQTGEVLPNVAVYSNRPPKEIKGGAVRMIAAMPVKVWVGPSDKPVPDEEWAKMSDAEKHTLEGPSFITYNGKTFKVYTFRAPQSMYDAHYGMIANGLIWPISHSTDAVALVNPSKLASLRHRNNYNYQYGTTQINSRRRAVFIPGDPEKDYALYKAFNDLGNQAIKQLKRSGEISGQDLMWVHDYQCVNVAGDIYTHHIPFPSLAFLQQVRVNGNKLLSSGFFQDFIKQMADHSLMTFHRAVDMKNFIEVAATFDNNFKTLNPQVYLPIAYNFLLFCTNGLTFFTQGLLRKAFRQMMEQIPQNARAPYETPAFIVLEPKEEGCWER